MYLKEKNKCRQLEKNLVVEFFFQYIFFGHLLQVSKLLNSMS